MMSNAKQAHLKDFSEKELKARHEATETKTTDQDFQQDEFKKMAAHGDQDAKQPESEPQQPRMTSNHHSQPEHG